MVGALLTVSCNLCTSSLHKEFFSTPIWSCLARSRTWLPTKCRSHPHRTMLTQPHRGGWGGDRILVPLSWGGFLDPRGGFWIDGTRKPSLPKGTINICQRSREKFVAQTKLQGTVRVERPINQMIDPCLRWFTSAILRGLLYYFVAILINSAKGVICHLSTDWPKFWHWPLHWPLEKWPGWSI